MIRDEELNRLIRYAQGMGLSVRFKPYVKGSKNEAEWALDGSEIVVYTTSKSTKLEKILSLIHEIAHHRAFVDANRTIDPKVEEALDSDKKVHRKRILDMEVNDAIYWMDIYKDTNCQFPINRLHKQREFDIYQYKVYYETGEFPTQKEKRKKWKELRNKYGK